jgi:hypothetical protein
MADNAIDLNDLSAFAAAAAARKAKGQGDQSTELQEDAASSFGRSLALGGRSVAQGVGGLVGMFSDPIAAVQNALIGPQGAIYPVFEEGVQPLRDQVSNILTEFGVPEPLTVTERIIGAITEGAAGAGGQVAAARGIASALTGTGRAVMQYLAAQPGAQLAAGGSAGGAAQTAAELGAGPIGTTAAALGGGGVGGRLASTKIGPPNAALPAAIREAEQSGIRVMTTDVREPTTFAGKWLQRLGEMIPIAGTGGPRAAQQQERIDASVDLLRNYGVSEASAADSSVISSVTKDLLGRRGANLTKYTGMKTDVIEGLKDVGTVDVTRTVKAIDDEVSKLRGLRSSSYDPVIARLEDWKKAITGTREVSLPGGGTRTEARGQPITNIEQLRKDVGAAFTSPELSSVRSIGEKALSRIYAPLREDMADFIKANGQRRDFDKWKIANKKLSSMAGELELGVMKNALAKGDATPEVVRSMLFSAKPSDVKALYRNLSADGKRNARTAVLQEAFNKIGGNFENVSPDQFKRQLIRLSSPIGVFFSGQDLKAIDGLARALKMTEQAGRAGVSPPTGVQNLPVLGGMILTDIFGGLGGGIVSGATIGGAARLYESAPVRNLLLKLPQTVKGSAQERDLVNQLTAAIRAQKAAEDPEKASAQ